MEPGDVYFSFCFLVRHDIGAITIVPLIVAEVLLHLKGLCSLSLY